MMGYVTLSGGLLGTGQLLALLVMTVAGNYCTGKNPVIDPPALVVKFGSPATATCRTEYNADLIGWEATMGGTNKENAQQLVWNVSSITDWSLKGGITCFVSTDEQCTTHLPVTIYKIPENVDLVIHNAGPLVEEHTYWLECEVQSVAPVNNLTVIWFRGDSKLEQSDFTQFNIVGDRDQNVTVRANLSITASREDNRASYSCAAQLDLNTPEPIPNNRSNSILLEVLYEPTIVSPSEDVSLTEGDRLELNCTADANPSPTYEWRRDNKTLENISSSSSTLLIESVEMDSAGVYECIVSNTQGKVSVKMTVAVWRNYLTWIAILVAIAILVLLAVFIGIYCTYHKKNKTGAYILAKFKGGNSQNEQVAHTNGNTA
ncbi:carcinoembryonic antigen-related cell adhesion molecule 5-like isoform X2 [Alosa alosa]|uniref:carcinoembryonic antigen-related cell adhesion molecule 5-like isoform X2 n=1 Tax=Alosa alosa TaxID=278164 RepID=UPI00201528AB|nr:carcinoembryonic antigen-related cell adhesion molecule 5-like isoform X2 [Alosa alosa]